ncbi:MAG: hypothetical protein AMJ91_04990 [candidate division Zixibacteria bacterium SM23_73_3]|nr:MAG: hypothetical protein AMJ91_04990 [candidate division Zixibacteria bacterium SM23_73_3]
MLWAQQRILFEPRQAQNSYFLLVRIFSIPLVNFYLRFCFFWNWLKKACFKRFEIKFSKTPVGFVECGIPDCFFKLTF